MRLTLDSKQCRLFSLHPPTGHIHTRCRPVRASQKQPDPKQDNPDEAGFGLEKLDPVSLGRRSRQAFDGVWNQFAKLSSPVSSFSESELGVFADASYDYQTPQAECTTVLVVGATGTAGKVLVRKLLLRGYRVQVLVRNNSNAEEEFPPAVQVIEGDVCDPKACMAAVSGVDKVIYAAAARSQSKEEFTLVEDQGVGTLIKAFQNYRNKKARSRGGISSTTKRDILDSKRANAVNIFTVQELGTNPNGEMNMREVEGEKIWVKTPDFASLSISKKKRNLLFKGELLLEGAIADAGRPLGPDETLVDYDGIILRVRGDGHQYSVVLTSETSGKRYSCGFPTKVGYMTARLPFNMFRPEKPNDPALDLTDIATLALSFRNTGRPANARVPPGNFDIEVDWIKALPTGQESDVILMSCAGQPRPNMSTDTLDSLIKAKRSGETRVRNSGLGYTIVRATHLINEPGGYKALVFDQGDRLSKGISAADAADVCVRSLHQPLARNRTFEVSQENTPEGGLEMYELVAHVPDKSTNYLGAALQNLERNT